MWMNLGNRDCVGDCYMSLLLILRPGKHGCLALFRKQPAFRYYWVSGAKRQKIWKYPDLHR